VKTFSVGFDCEGTVVDESGEAAQTAKFVGADHIHVVVRGGDVRDRIFHIASSLDQPTVDGVNSYFVSWAARQAVTVAISGTGGDEMFAGYPWFQTMQTDVLLPRSLWTQWRASLARMNVFDTYLAGKYGAQLYTARNQAGFLSRYALQYHIFNSLGAARLISPSLRVSAQAGTAENVDLLSIDELPNADVIERVSALCLRGYTVNQLLRDIDAASMAHSLEVRVPYLDPVLADLALSLPFASKSGAGDTSDPSLVGTYRYTGAKKILIDAGKYLLPPNFDVQPKRGFTLPFDFYLKGVLKDVLQNALSDEVVRRRDWFDTALVADVKKSYDAGTSSWAFVWLLMMVELWAQEVLDK
jgi:asparagine synthase (glutamine-hydrolysing)